MSPRTLLISLALLFFIVSGTACVTPSPEMRARLAEMESDLAEKKATISSLRGNMSALQSRVSQYETDVATGRGNLQCSIEAPPIAYPGETIPYKLRVQNISSEPILSIEIFCHLPKGLEPVEMGGGSFEPASRTITWHAPSLSPKGKEVYSFTAKTNNVGSYECSVDVRHRVGSPKVSILKPVIACKVIGPSIHGSGTDFELTVSVTNTGTGIARDVKGVVKRTRGISILSGTNKGPIDFGDIPAGTEVVRTLKVHGEDEGEYQIQIIVKGLPALSEEASFSGELVAPHLELTQKPAHRVRYFGQEMEFNITVRSTGTDTARDVVLVNTLPKGADFISSTPEGKVEGNKVTWNLGNLDSGSSATIKLRTRADRAGALINRLQAQAKGVETIKSSSKVEVIGVVGMMLDCVDTIDPVEVGQQTSYVIRVRNQSGHTDATHVVIRAELPEECEYVGADSSAGVSHQRNPQKHEIVFDPVAAVQPGHEETFRIHVRFTKNGDAVFSASLQYKEFAKPVRSEEGTYVYGK